MQLACPGIYFKVIFPQQVVRIIKFDFFSRTRRVLQVAWG